MDQGSAAASCALKVACLTSFTAWSFLIAAPIGMEEYHKKFSGGADHAILLELFTGSRLQVLFLGELVWFYCIQDAFN